MRIEHFNQGERIPALDGMRAIAILLVLVGHSLDTIPSVTDGDVYRVVGMPGPLGVRFFFVISGFLITTILLRELEQTGRLSLKRFFVRRAFRIFPAFYCFLGVMFVVNLTTQLAIPLWDWITAATYTINYRENRDWNVSHLWSLAVEEQFYLLWPMLLCFLSKRRALIGALLVVLIVPWVRYGTHMWFPEQRAGIIWEFHTVCDGLAMGCLLAGFRERLASSRFYRRFRTPFYAGFALFLIFLVNKLTYGRPQWSALVTPTVLHLAMVWLIDILITHPNCRFGRVLNSAPMVYLGVLSYSLYLWQQPFLHKTSHVLQSFPLNIGLAFAAACISYYLVERPCLQLRRRLKP